MPNHTIDREQLQQYFHLPINEVARKLGVCATVLKKICRKNGVPRWPHRKIRSLDKMIVALEETAPRSKEDAERIRQEIAALNSKKEFIISNPAVLALQSNIQKCKDSLWSEDIVSVEQSFPLGYAEPETPPSPPTKVQVDPQTKISPLRTSPISSPEDNSWGEANEEQKIDDPLCELYQNLFLPCFLKTYHRTEDSSGSSSYYDVNSPVEFPGPKLYLPGQSLLPTWVKKKSS